MAKRKKNKRQPVKPSHPGVHWTNDRAIGPDEHISFMVRAGRMQVGNGVMEVRRTMPTTTEGLEQLAVEDLATALGRRGHNVAVLPRPGGNFPDAKITVDGSSPIGIEIAEIVVPKHEKGAPYSADQEALMDLVAEPVRKKIAKRYDRSGYETLWLLLWETFPYALHPGNKDKAVLTMRSAKGFDALWFCHITGDSDMPDAERWWPPELAEPRP